MCPVFPCFKNKSSVVLPTKDFKGPLLPRGVHDRRRVLRRRDHRRRAPARRRAGRAAGGEACASGPLGVAPLIGQIAPPISPDTRWFALVSIKRILQITRQDLNHRSRFGEDDGDLDKDDREHPG